MKFTILKSIHFDINKKVCQSRVVAADVVNSSLNLVADSYNAVAVQQALLANQHWQLTVYCNIQDMNMQVWLS